MVSMGRFAQDLHFPDPFPVGHKRDESVLVRPSGLVGKGIAGAENLKFGIARRIFGAEKDPHRDPFLLNLIIDGMGLENRSRRQRLLGKE